MRMLPILILAAPLAILLLLAVLISGGVDSAVASDIRGQCDLALPNPSSTVRVYATDSTRTASALPPLTEYPIAPDDTSVSDRDRACADALWIGVHQPGPPLSVPATGAAAQCAGEIIAALAIRGNGATDNTGRASTDAPGVVQPAAVTAAVARRASAAVPAGGCRAPSDAEIDALITAHSGTGPGRCPLPGAQPIVEIPDNAAAQSLCGLLVVPTAASPGDLVFWDYRGSTPAGVGMVTSAGSLSAGRPEAASVVVVSWDPTSGRPVLLAVPSTWDVRVKRVLGDAA